MNPANDALTLILSAFAGVKKPSSLLHPKCQDDNDITIFKRTTNWEMIPDKWIEAENAALCFASSKGFQYLIPAFMSFSIRNIFSSAMSVDSTIYALNPSGETKEFQESKLEFLSSEQKNSIRLFLQFTSFNRDRVDWTHAKQAIEYWKDK